MVDPNVNMCDEIDVVKNEMKKVKQSLMERESDILEANKTLMTLVQENFDLKDTINKKDELMKALGLENQLVIDDLDKVTKERDEYKEKLEAIYKALGIPM